MPQVSPTPATTEPAAQQPTETQATQPEPAAKAKAQQPPAPETQTPSPQSIGEPAAGTTWLQVVATTRPDAELISETLSKRGFHTQVAPAPNGFFRVLVGPAKGAAEVSDLRTRLEGAGFRNPIVRKY
jgi:cell division septation protein DedD